MLRILLALAALLAPLSAQAAWRIVAFPRSDVTLRAAGIDRVGHLHVSGSRNTYAESIDGGATWRLAPIDSEATFDFRGLAALDDGATVLMSAGEAAKGLAFLVRSIDGRAWAEVFRSVEPGAFLDTVSFRDARNGFVLGDPIDGRWFLLRTRDGGRSWKRLAGPAVEDGEAAFAASNSALFLGPGREIWIVSGGLAKGRVHRSVDDGKHWTVSDTPLVASQTAGLFGGVALGRGRAAVVGGDYKDELAPGPSIALGDGAWISPPHAGTPRLLEGVARLDARTLIAVGPRGTSVSADGGKTWKQTDQEAFHAIACRAGACVAAGGKGRVGVWIKD